MGDMYTMSMNLYVRAYGIVTTPNGKQFEYEERFDLPQTTTYETKEVMRKEDQLEAYKSLKQYRNVVPKLEKWIEQMKNLGFEIEWYEL